MEAVEREREGETGKKRGGGGEGHTEKGSALYLMLFPLTETL